ncbi:MAG: hypothetical protein MJ238_03445 [Bacilli bacterium]|nr:hypothetical protein [Bacilli bacterium]
MGKRNVIILLLMPFVIALACLTSISITFNLIDTDIIGIAWNYAASEAFKISTTPYKLEAYGQNQKNYPVMNANLQWSVANKDPEDTVEHARIVDSNKLYADSVGEVVLTCSNAKGTVFKNLDAVIYENAAILINPSIAPSGTNIDKTIYFGEYDLDSNGNKVKAQFDIDIATMPASEKGNIKLETISDNLTIDSKNKTVSILGARSDDELSTIKFAFTSGLVCDNNPSLSFKVVKDGVNVYDYNQLLKCTNDSENGEIVVLRKSFESKDNLSGASNVTLFGNEKNGKFNFDSEVYRFKTSESDEYIQQWNAFASKNRDYSTISNNVIAGLRVQKDFYGNGYTLNLHNLTYPYETTTVDGNIIPTLTKDNLFRRPLPFFVLGDPNGLPLVTAYGQDNIGMYLDGDNITVNDVNIKNCDFGNNLANLDTVGTVLETNGKNITVSNSRLSNGKTVMRAYDSDVLLNNSLLSYSRNFLLSCGSYEFVPVNKNANNSFVTDSGSTVTKSLEEYLAKGSDGDSLLSSFVSGSKNEYTKDAVLSIQKALNSGSDYISDLYKGHIEVKDSFFYMSNIASIALESMFNGPYLFNSSPSLIGSLFGTMSFEGKSIVPLEATGIGGVSYPVELNISGKTRFYDYKKSEGFDLGGLINENISTIANEVFGRDVEINMDDIFPIKPLIMKQASSRGCVYNSQINVPIAFYGGGPNFSKVSFAEGSESETHLSSPIVTDMLSELLGLGQTDTGAMTGMRDMMKRSVLVCTGYENFKFILAKNDGYLFDKAPNIQDLINNSFNGGN